jgi:hypothetical protein
LLDRVDHPTNEVRNPHKEFQFIDMLPNAQVQERLMGRMAVLVSRVITRYLEAFSPLKDVVDYHIPHKYSKEMEKKSNSVSVSYNVILWQLFVDFMTFI